MTLHMGSHPSNSTPSLANLNKLSEVAKQLREPAGNGRKYLIDHMTTMSFTIIFQYVSKYFFCPGENCDEPDFENSAK